MQRKYNVINADWRDWRDYVKFERNIDKENELFYNVLGLKDGEDYVYVNRHWQTRPTKEVYSGISDDPETYGCKVVQHDIIEGFSVFDWCKVFINAVEIHTVHTGICYIHDRLPLQCINYYMYQGLQDPNVQYIPFKKKPIWVLNPGGQKI